MIGTVRKMHTFRLPPREIYCRNYRNYNKELFVKDLKSVPWEHVYNISDVNAAYNSFEAFVSDSVKKFAPMMKRKVRAIRCPWRTSEINDAIKTRDYYLRKAMKSGADNYWYHYKNARNKVNGLIRKSKAQYHQSLISKNAKDPKNFLKAVKQVYPMKETPPSSCKEFEISGRLIDDKRDIANSFCEFFTSQAANLSELLPNQFKCQNASDVVQTPHNFNFRPITKAKVLRNLNNLKASKSAGPDNLPPRLMKDAAEALAGPLTYLINLSFKQSTFPYRLKVAKVIPLFKSGPRKNLDNYRPISILPILSKIFERIA